MVMSSRARGKRPAKAPQKKSLAKDILPDEEFMGSTSLGDDSDNDTTFYMCSLPFRYAYQTAQDLPDGWVECYLSAHVKDQICANTGYLQPLQHPDPKPYYIHETNDGKGLGMFAARNIAPGDLICDERPLFILPVSFGFPKNLVPPHGSLNQRRQASFLHYEHTLELLRDRMLAENQIALMSLCDSYHVQGVSGNIGPILGILKTNALSIEGLQEEGPNLGRYGEYVGVFKDISRVNHCCIPNTARHFCISSLSMHLRASRAIQQGEQITTTYLDSTFASAFERNRALSIKYGFNCRCRSCLKSKKSDPLRTSFIYPSTLVVPPDLTLVGNNAQLDDSWIKPSVDKIRGMENEGLQFHEVYVETLSQVFAAYVGIANEVMVQTYGRKLIDALLIQENTIDARLLREMLTKPSKLPSWGEIRKAVGKGEPIQAYFPQQSIVVAELLN